MPQHRHGSEEDLARVGRTENEVTTIPTDLSKSVVEDTLGVTGEPDLSNIVEAIRSLAVPISALRPDPRNARKHGKENLEAIAKSLKDFKQQKPIVVSSDGIILAGNGTVSAAKSLGWTHVAAVRSDLSGTDATAFAIADNRTAELAEWDRGELASLLREIPENRVVGFSTEDLTAILSPPTLSGKYSVKIVPPVYEPKGTCPPVDELVDREKTRALVEEIENSETIRPEVARLLRFAAERHSVFDYAKIAEFYCHASADEKRLFEKSGLVIIDLGSAIENGFVELTDRIVALSAQEEGSDEE